MGKALEWSIEAIVVDHAEKNGWFFRKVGWTGRKGCPDRFFAKDGRVVFVEFKRKGKEPNGLQIKEIERMRAAGVEVHVIDDIEVGKALFQ